MNRPTNSDDLPRTCHGGSWSNRHRDVWVRAASCSVFETADRNINFGFRTHLSSRQPLTHTETP